MPLHSVHSITVLVYEEMPRGVYKVSDRIWICHAEVKQKWYHCSRSMAILQFTHISWNKILLAPQRIGCQLSSGYASLYNLSMSEGIGQTSTWQYQLGIPFFFWQVADIWRFYLAKVMDVWDDSALTGHMHGGPPGPHELIQQRESQVSFVDVPGKIPPSNVHRIYDHQGSRPSQKTVHSRPSPSRSLEAIQRGNGR